MADKKNRIKAYYDRYADVYDVKHGVALAGQAHNFFRYYEPFLHAAVAPGTRILELGCGNGVYTRWLCDRGCQVVAMDLSPRMVERARQRCPRAIFIEGDCEDPGAHLSGKRRAEGFDAIVGVNTFSYYTNKDTALRRYGQLLRPRGRIVLIDMNGRCPFYRIMTWTGKNEMKHWYGEVRESTRPVLEGLVQRAGLQVKTLTHFAFIPNGVGPPLVALLRPLDALLGRLPLVRDYAMRVGLVACAP